MIGSNELKPGVFFIYEDQPYQVLETHHLKMQQRRPVVQTKMKNVLNGKLYERNFAQSDLFELADIERQNVKFLYAHTRLPAGRQDEYWFSEENSPAKRFQLSEAVIGDSVKFLKPNTICQALLFNSLVINIELPVKMEFRVVEAPPAIRGDTAQGGVKQVKLENGAQINVPLFINQDDTIRINTESGEYVERVSKS